MLLIWSGCDKNVITLCSIRKRELMQERKSELARESCGAPNAY